MFTIKLSGSEELMRRIERTMLSMSSAALDTLAEEAEEIKRRSQARAPLLTGDLENAHHVVVKDRRIGPIVSGSAEIIVDPCYNDDGLNYAIVMHEGIYNLGKISRDKNNGKAPHIGDGVGRKFLERALEEQNQGNSIIRKMADNVTRVMNAPGSIISIFKRLF